MRLTLIVLITLIFSISASARSPEPGDFARGLKINAPDGASIYKITLPGDVYKNLDRDDYGDIRIFNAGNEIVPFSIKTPTAPKQSPASDADIPFFPIYRSGKLNTDEIRLNVKTDASGAIINFQTEQKDEKEEALAYYLLDLTHLTDIPDRLVVKWRTTKDSYSIHTFVEQSNNLTDWSSIRTDSVFASLDFSGHTLVKDSIQLPSTRIKYLRISWPDKQESFEISGAAVRFPDRRESTEPQWLSLSPAAYDEKENALEYRITGHYPISSVNIEPAGENPLFKARILSRKAPDVEWKTRYQGIFHKIDLNGTYFFNPDHPVGRTNHRYWRIEILSEGLKAEKAPLRLKLGWIPHDVYFLNQGSGPFTLAVGNFEAEPPEDLVSPVLSSLTETRKKEMVKDASAGDLFKLGERKIKKTPLPWQKWSLWAILLLGVLLLGIMAVRISRQMKKESGSARTQ